MTKAEAAACMRSYLPNEHEMYRYTCETCPYYASREIAENVFLCCATEAFVMAIEALEREARLDEKHGRQQLIDLLYGSLDKSTTTKHISIDGGYDKDGHPFANMKTSLVEKKEEKE